jgi:copper(I)-binding protein
LHDHYEKGVIIGCGEGSVAGGSRSWKNAPRARYRQRRAELERNSPPDTALEREMCMRYSLIGVLAAAAALAVPIAFAAESVKVANAWVRAPVSGQKTAAAYLELTADRNLALVAAGSPAAGRVEMHSMTMDGGVMRMRALPRVDLPAGQTVRLAPGGTHLMLLELKQPLKPGDKLPLTLSLQPSEPTASSLTTITVEAEIRAAGTSSHSH